MKKDLKKYIFYFILPFIAIAIYYGYDYISNMNKPVYSVYKPGYINDCANNVVEVSNELDFTKIIKENNIELVNAYQTNTSLYKDSFCVNKKIVSFDYVILDQFKINHIQGNNNQIYQLSYNKIIEALNKNENKKTLDKKVIGAINYYLSDANLVQYINSFEDYQVNKPLIGPKAEDKDGKYVLNLGVNLVRFDIYKDKEHTKFNNSVYVFDSLNLSYVKVGENNE